MKNKPKIMIVSLCLTLLAAAIAAPAFADNRKSTSTAAASRDTLRNIWVFFKDKDSRHSPPPVSARAALRRSKAGFRNIESDRPVNSNYIREVERRGASLRTAFPWGNAASFSVNPSRIAEISSLPFVKAITPVAVYINKKVDGRADGLYRSKSKFSTVASGGGYDWHTEMVGVPLAHDYIRYKGLGAPGSGVVMAFFDGGFRLDHAAYKRLRDNSQVIAVRDFVDDDADVADPDWVANNPRSPYYKNDRHGSQVLSLAAAYAPGVYLGTAYGAAFALARTEDDAVESRVEEDNWAAAVLWADTVGARIISSSLGYRDDHTDPEENYNYNDMDGVTAIVSKAAAEAIDRGMIVVNAMGNEGSRVLGTITAPADVDGVVSVGAVTQNHTITDFSSTGPTSDGRMKPEVVAPGYLVPVPEPYSDDHASYTIVNGTSFSAPIISAIMALILQARPDISMETAKERLYASCRFALGQNVADNKFGYGIPNAALAVMDTNEIFLKITNNAKKTLAGAVAELDGRTYTADTAGNILIKAQNSSLPIQIRISYRNSAPDTLTVNALPFAQVVEMNKKWDDGFKVAPNITQKNGVIRGRYAITGAKASTPIVATIRTLSGRKVWKKKLYLRSDGSADFEWDVRNGNGGVAASGMYLVVIQYGYSIVCERVVVSN